MQEEHPRLEIHSALDLASIVGQARRVDGFVSGGPGRYHRSCTRRAAHHRKRAGLRNLRYTPLPMSGGRRRAPEGLTLNRDVLLAVLFEAEGYLAAALDARRSLDLEDVPYSRIRSRLLRRLTKALERATVASDLATKLGGDPLSAALYREYMAALLEQEREDYLSASKHLYACEAILRRALAIPGADTTSLQVFSEEITQRTAYCRYMAEAFADGQASVALDAELAACDACVAALPSPELPFLEIKGVTGLVRVPVPITSAAAVHYRTMISRYISRIPSDQDPQDALNILTNIYASLLERVSTALVEGHPLSSVTMAVDERRQVQDAAHILARAKSSLAEFVDLYAAHSTRRLAPDYGNLVAGLRPLCEQKNTLVASYGVCSLVHRLLFLLGVSGVTVTGTPAADTCALWTSLSTGAALSGMNAPNHRAVSALGESSSPVIRLVAAMHSLESGLYAMERSGTEMYAVAPHLFKQAASRFHALASSARDVRQGPLDFAEVKLLNEHVGIQRVVRAVLSSEALLRASRDMCRRYAALLESFTAVGETEELAFVLPAGLFPPPLMEEVVPDVIQPDVVKAAAKQDPPKRKKWFGIF
ncbi:Signal recognition particle [Giardia muris]|uniref:Signal recognition particle subunit SRP68 n=1 Tax=Giardia muris TaxID=5742 RepID=A0A4Z1SM10_GIAMU|nr:Signal recognition particle [Giardia muris]|eukprot:TNJ26702.1 Signal recognition particle [Giardia muris]